MFNFDFFVAMCINGLLMGGVYALVAVGLTLIFGVMKIINFAHGTLMMLGMYTCYWLFTLWGMDPYLSLLITAPLFFLFGLLLQRLFIAPILDAPEQSQILLTMGLSLIMENLALFFWTADMRTVEVIYGKKAIPIGEAIMINPPQLVAFLVAFACTGILYLFLKRTDMGKAIRACSEQKEGALLMGINVKWIYLVAFGLGSACVGIAGTVTLPFFYAAPSVGSTFILAAFVVVVVGGMGNFFGAFFGGLIIGLAESLGILFLKPSMRQLTIFIIFILILLFKPTGIFSQGKR